MKAYETHQLAHQWERATGTSLRKFIDIMPDATVIPNTDALDEWLSPEDGESIRDVLQQRYGDCAVEVLMKLF